MKGLAAPLVTARPSDYDGAYVVEREAGRWVIVYRIDGRWEDGALTFGSRGAASRNLAHARRMELKERQEASA